MFEDAQASDVTPEAIQRVLADVAGQAWRHDILRTAKMATGLARGSLGKANPASLVRTHRPVRGERILPLSPGEVDLGRGRGGPVGSDDPVHGRLTLAGEVVIRGGTSTLTLGRSSCLVRRRELAWRTVHLATRGTDAIRQVPRALQTRRVFHIDGRPVSFDYFRREVWHPALLLAG